MEATLELAVSKVINSVPGIPPKSEYGAAAHQYMSSMAHYPDHAVRSPRHLITPVMRWMPSRDGGVSDFPVLSVVM